MIGRVLKGKPGGASVCGNELPPLADPDLCAAGG